jgi:hypothetical protein
MSALDVKSQANGAAAPDWNYAALHAADARSPLVPSPREAGRGLKTPLAVSFG